MNNLKITKIVNSAYENVPFYKNLYSGLNILQIKNAHVKELPTIDKNMLINSIYLNFSNKYNFYDPNVALFKTSGSTGKCLDVYWLSYEYKSSMIELWLNRKKYYNIYPSDKLCVLFSTQQFSSLDLSSQIVAYSKNCMIVNKLHLSNKNLNYIYRKIYEYSPRWMILQPSVAVILCTYIKKNNLPKFVNLEYVELTGEFLSRKVRDLILEVLNCKIANQYGCTEVNSIAYECPNGHMHISKCSNFVEIIRDGHTANYGEYGFVHVTSLNNSLMPFIRYNTGDIGCIYPSVACDCGNSGEILDIKNGRSIEFAVSNKGELINTGIFVYVFEFINRIMDNIVLQYQIVQNSYKQFTVKIVLDGFENYDYNKNLIINNFQNQIKQTHSFFEICSFEFEFYEHLFPEERTGKLSFFKSFVKNDI